jgi:hypothetical protein
VISRACLEGCGGVTRREGCRSGVGSCVPTDGRSKGGSPDSIVGYLYNFLLGGRDDDVGDARYPIRIHVPCHISEASALSHAKLGSV